MKGRELLDALQTALRLKDATRHCYTAGGRRESVAEHSWSAALTACFIKDEFPGVDTDKVIKMCLIHDIGEAFTGDIPSFDKTEADEITEERMLADWVKTLPPELCAELTALYAEMNEMKTPEARLYKAIDGFDAVIQHNLSDLSTWIPKEYELNKTYAEDRCGDSEFLKELRREMRTDTEKKIADLRKE